MLAPRVAKYPGQMKRPKLHFALSVPFIALKNVRHLLFIFFFFLRYAPMGRINFRVMRVLMKMVILHPYYFRFNFDVFLKDDMLHLLGRAIFKAGVDIEKIFREYFEHFSYLYDGLIYMSVPHEVMRERFTARFKERSEKFRQSRDVIHGRVFRQNQVWKSIIEEQTEIPYIVLDGTAPVAQNADAVVQFIKTKIFKG